MRWVVGVLVGSVIIYQDAQGCKPLAWAGKQLATLRERHGLFILRPVVAL